MNAENAPDRDDENPILPFPYRHPLELPVAEPWPTPVHAAGLLDWIRDLINKYVVCPPHAPEMLALWTLHTYAFHLRNVTTYLGVVSPERRCGKTTLLRLLGMMANRALLASNISSPAVFRTVEEAQPTLIMDELDTFLKGNSELRGILNAGYTRDSAYVVRVEGRGSRKYRTEGSKGSEGKPQKSQLVKFSCWCPKVMSGIGRLPETLADRCIMITMQRKTKEERCERLRNPDTTELRQKCVRFVQDNAEKIARWEPKIPECLNDRAADVWEPLLVLAELAGGEWPERARTAAEALSGVRQPMGPTAVLLVHIKLLFETTKCDRLFTRTIVQALNQFDAIKEMRAGKGLTEVWLSRQLSSYGVESRAIWIGEECAKGYYAEDLRAVFERYL